MRTLNSVEMQLVCGGDITEQERVIDGMFGTSGSILCTGVWDRSTQWSNPPPGTWATTTNGYTFYDVDNDGHWDGVGREGASGDGEQYDWQLGTWINDPDATTHGPRVCGDPV